MFQFVGQFRHTLETPQVVNRLSQLDNPRGQPAGINVIMLDAVAEDVSEQLCLSKKFLSLGTERGSTCLGAQSSIAGGYFTVGGSGMPGRLRCHGQKGKCADRQRPRCRTRRSASQKGRRPR